LVSNIYAGRKIAKKEMFKYQQEAIDAKEANQDFHHLEELASLKDTEQMTAKIQINSLYGGLAAKHFSLFNESIAQSITGNGRFFIKLLANNIEDRLQSLIKSDIPYIIAGDTDSVYVQIAKFVDKYVPNENITKQTKWCDAFYNKVINPIVEDTIQELANKLNAFDPDFIGVSREAIADSGIWVAKKAYALRVRDLEGKHFPENDPYLKIQGLDIIKGGTSKFSKKYLKEAIPVMLDMDLDGVQEWYKKTRLDFTNWPLDEIAKTQGVSKVENPNWGKIINGRKVSVPFGSRVCVTTNNFIKDNNLMDRFPLITAGEKVKVLFLLEPNKMKDDAFAFNDLQLAEMFKDQIDYDTTFEKYFLSSLKGMLEAIGIDINNHTDTLDEW
jgi:DNA polymerase elongation subunit (family B)